MLYHLDDLAGAVCEARRVLREGGRFTAVVNREQPYPYLMALLREVLAGHGITPPPSPDERVHGGNLPAFVAAGFAPDTIRVLRRDNALLFPGPEPVVAYLASILTLQGVPDDPDLHRAITADLDKAARARFRTLSDGIWREPKGYVVVTATA
ncbi:hypothetical protein [Catenulispora rubra]|uniref:hypothetical protein n=1 Tax=Catenulispora rubra TaxID=280293 RepID=UPI0018925539|nr:hypothetical protein [Catenulispora rubra]